MQVCGVHTDSVHDLFSAHAHSHERRKVSDIFSTLAAKTDGFFLPPENMA